MSSPSNDEDQPQVEKPLSARSADDALPPVEPPSMTFVLQLFLIPLLIVSIIVAVWLGVTWVVELGGSPQGYVADLRKSGEGSWQSAASLADMLRSPRNEHLKRDVALANSLAEVLEQNLESKNYSEGSINLRKFLCRALGEFQVPQGISALMLAASTERDPREMEVRAAAIESIAVLADNTDPDELVRREPKLLDILFKASQEFPSSDLQFQSSDDAKTASTRFGEFRSRAAFALGVIGNQAALDRLAEMNDDPYPNARFNAATGLARHGDVRAVKVLEQMLDPENDAIVAGEGDPSYAVWKRALVLVNGLNATDRLAQKNPTADLSSLEKAIERLLSANLDPMLKSRVQTLAKEVDLRLKERKAGAQGQP